MDTPARKAARLLDALDELVGDEGLYLRGGHYDLAVETRQRTAPLVDALAAMAGDPAMADFQPRVAALVRRGTAHDEFLKSKMGEMGEEIRRTDQARYRAAQMAPAYATGRGVAASRFLAAG